MNDGVLIATGTTTAGICEARTCGELKVLGETSSSGAAAEVAFELPVDNSAFLEAPRSWRSSRILEMRDVKKSGKADNATSSRCIKALTVADSPESAVDSWRGQLAYSSLPGPGRK